MKSIGIGRAHSKIILMGEHAVVYGFSAVALPLKTIEVVCEIRPAKEPLQENTTDPLVTAIFAALAHLAITASKISYQISSSVPQRRGMGSSAAVAIAAIRSVFDYYEQPLDDPTLEMLVNQAEKIAHINPSGLDAKACLSDTALAFSRNTGFTRLELALKAYLVIADTGIHGQTSVAVDKVRRQGDQALPLLGELGQLADTFTVALRHNDLVTMGSAMTKAHAILDDLGVSSIEANHLVRVAIDAGALGAKMSGGGLGGCVIALTDTAEKATQLARLLEKEGALNTWIETL